VKINRIKVLAEDIIHIGIWSGKVSAQIYDVQKLPIKDKILFVEYYLAQEKQEMYDFLFADQKRLKRCE
jgi:hypothetical protein